jgi:predicted ATPase/class 3 adenylate cyclase
MTGPDLPRGTVTLLFADVEGSTRLLHSLGDRYAGVRGRLRELVRETVAELRGHEVDWAGDGAFLAFSGARDAVAAAVALQAAIEREPWPEDGVVRVRIGVHTGEPELGDEGYVGLDVHVAARICAAGHGRQILVSQATRDVVGDLAVPGGSFRSLGRHRLKDVPEPQQLFQLVAPGLAEDFPPLRTLGGATLPALHHRLVGRSAELAIVEAVLARPEVRLVTIAGPGGAGKSRLALEIAGAEAVDRPVHLVGLAPITDPELVPAAIARILGVHESPGQPLVERVGEALKGTGALLVLDNLEHLPEATPYLRQLLDAAPDLKILATSRVPLRLSAEHVVPLEPLRVDDASTLFAELAAARGVVLREDALPSVREICRRLDGLPLAIELVAARLVVLPPAQILAALDEGLALEMEGPVDLPERQRTLRATIEWSYGLLNESQRELHGALAVFPGGCTLTDARTFAEPGSRFLADLEALVAWSLLRSDVTDGDVRLSMLETVREHAVARLEEEGALEELRRRHAERFLALALAAHDELAGPDRAVWLARLVLELDNIRASLDWLLAAGRVEDALQATAALERFWQGHALVSEARRWLSVGLELAENVSPDVRGDALWTAAVHATAQYDWDAAVPLLEEALAVFRESDRGRETVFVLCELSFLAFVRDDHAEAEKLAEEALALARELGDTRAISAALAGLADARSLQGDHERALEHWEEATALRRTLGDELLVVDATYNLGIAAFRANDLERARQAVEESLAGARAMSAVPHTAAALFTLAEVDLLTGDHDRAREEIRESLDVYSELENERARAGCLVVLGGVAVAEGSYEEGARLFGAAAALRGESPPNDWERRVLERFEPALDDALGTERVVALAAEGAGLGRSGVRELVATHDAE